MSKWSKIDEHKDRRDSPYWSEVDEEEHAAIEDAYDEESNADSISGRQVQEFEDKVRKNRYS